MKYKSSFSDNELFFHKPQRIIRISAMLKLLGVSRTILWRWVKESYFSKPQKTKRKTKGWTVKQYHDWLSKQR